MTSPANSEAMELVEAIKAEALRLGFSLVGITTPDPLPHFDVYEAWLKAGRNAGMAYLASGSARQRRADPRHILPDCRSILVLAIRYPASSFKDMLDQYPGQAGRVASYAWGDDYHLVIPGRLEALVQFISAQVGYSVAHRIYTDSGPLLERELAMRAGLGWIGKNTCLIHPHLGSYFFLAEILLGIDLPPDPPFTVDRCGTCQRCLVACPTGCILPDRTLDAGRCISYLTIEHKGSIPADLRPLIGEWVFGCDICQQVCPWNSRFAQPDGDPSFAPRQGIALPDLVQELSLEQDAFSRKFKNSPLKRARRRGYLRNVATALGNSAGAEETEAVAIAALRQALQDAEPLVRGHAAWALGQFDRNAARQALRSAQASEQDPAVLAEIRQALSDVN
ncbi:MAG: tRNA epoxyqueuosine(34) reductase QueG [Anaerolineales bacterium]|nr:tRNA epoxyqueuosine(34) reductase QueG [Anaerolineales bacterium]